ncbi:MAG: hypothetical protein Kow00109_18390 [Acidobacteriota bacterium]
MRIRLGAAVLLVEIVALSLLGWYYLRSFSRWIDDYLLDQVRTPSRLINSGVLHIEFVADPEAIREILREDLLEGLVVDAEGKVLLALDSRRVGQRVASLLNLPPERWTALGAEGIVAPADPRGDRLASLIPVTVGEGQTPFLFLYAEISTARTQETKRNARLFVVAGSAATVLVTFLLLMAVSNLLVVRPVADANRLISRVAGGDYSYRISRLSGGEVGELQAGLNRMAERLENSFDTLQRNIEELDRARNELALREGFLTDLLAHLPVGVIVEEADGTVSFLNTAAAKMFGVSLEQVRDRSFLATVALESPDDWRRAVEQVRNELRSIQLEDVKVLSGGRGETLVSSIFVPFRDREGRLVRILSIHQDVTELRRRQEEQERMQRKITETQRLESLGVLAGGIAHDFNNLLMAILGNTDLARADLPAASPLRGYLSGIETAARRAAELCRQLLAYSGKGRFVNEAIDLRELVKELSEVMEVVVAKKARLVLEFASDVPPVEGDPSQLRQVVLNLLTNAAEAIPGNQGLVTVHIYRQHCDEEYLRSTLIDDPLPEGDYVVLEVSDTGVGMSPEVQQRIFEPFFTTKFSGRGLGMAAVLGIVRSHRGGIKIYSEPGKGTAVKILLPASEKPALAPSRRIELAGGFRGSGTVLLVDDEERVRSVARRMLERFGFDVLTAANGKEALAVFRAHRENVKLVLLDLTMPEMDGQETLRRLHEIDAAVPVVISSGYNAQNVTRRFVGREVAAFIQKPYRLSELEAVLKRVFGSPPEGS